MGANAQTSVPTFTAGEILTAANMNISAATGIPVFADSTARDAAFGGTGEKTLAEGQFAYLESTNATQYYDGSTWQAVGSSSGLVLVTATSTANTGGTVTSSGGRVTVAGSSSVSLNGVFTSTYHNYLILGDTVEAAAGPNNINLRLRASGTDTTTSTYYAGQIYGTYTGTTGGSANNGVAQFPLIGISTTKKQMFKVEVFSPQAATITTIHSLGVAHDAQSNYAGYQDGATQYDGFTLFMATSNFSGNITVYAYQKS
jgi:hypothetical protein